MATRAGGVAQFALIAAIVAITTTVAHFGPMQTRAVLAVKQIGRTIDDHTAIVKGFVAVSLVTAIFAIDFGIAEEFLANTFTATAFEFVD